MKRLIAITLCLVFALALVGCKGNSRAPLDGSGLAATTERAAVTAPVLGGMDATAAAAALSAAGLQLGAVTESYDETIPAGTLISQDPAPGAGAPKGTKVQVVVSKGPAPVPVPDVVDKTEAVATKALKAAGFSVAVKKAADAASKGTVVAQDPTGSAPRGSTVRITVSTGGGSASSQVKTLVGTWKGSDGTKYTFRHGNRVVVPGGGVVRYRNSGKLLIIFHSSGRAAQNTLVWDSPTQIKLTVLKSDGSDGATTTFKRMP